MMRVQLDDHLREVSDITDAVSLVLDEKGIGVEVPGVGSLPNYQIHYNYDECSGGVISLNGTLRVMLTFLTEEEGKELDHDDV